MRTILARFKGGSSGAAMARNAIGVFAVNVVGTSLTVGLQVWLARLLGVDEFGVYAYVLSWLNALLVVSLMGADSAILRYVAALHGTGEFGRFWGFLEYIRGHVAMFSVATALALALVVWGLGERMGVQLATAFWCGCLLLPINVLVSFNGSLLQALKRVIQAQSLQYVVRIGAMFGLLAILYFLLQWRVDAIGALVVNGISGLATLIGLWWLKGRLLPLHGESVSDAKLNSEWRSASFIFFAISGSQVLLAQVDILIIGIFMDTTHVGLYAAASRIATFVTFGITSINSVLAPTISMMFARGERAELQAVVTFASRIVLVYTIPVVLLFLVGGRWLLGWFGQEFVAAYPILVILTLGQVVIALCGSVGFLLTMTGHQNDAFKVIISSGMLALILNLLLIPFFGLFGAAVGTMLATAVRSLTLSVLVRRRLNVRATAFGV